MSLITIPQNANISHLLFQKRNSSSVLCYYIIILHMYVWPLLSLYFLTLNAEATLLSAGTYVTEKVPYHPYLGKPDSLGHV